MPKNPHRSVTIGIVTYNHRNLISPCLSSIARSNGDGRTEIKVIVVDNGSTDGSAELVRDHYPQVTLVPRNRCSSFAENNNVAFASSSGEYFLMLNPDTELHPDSVNILVEFMERYPECGICGPKLVFPDGSLQYSCRRFPTGWSTLLRRTLVRLIVPRNQRGRRHLMVSASHQETMHVDWMLGACLLIRRQAIPGSKLLDEGFPLYCEDIDLCRRLAKGGWETYYVPSTTVVHHHRARSDSKLLCRESLLHTRSMVHYVKKHYLLSSENTALHPGVTKLRRGAA